MTYLPSLRRAALFGLAISALACDVAAFANDPKPILEQSWNVPAASTSIAVAKLLPATVTTYSTPGSNPPDSSAFLLSVNPVNATRRVGDDCAACNPLHNTTAIKPAFVLTTGNASALPTNVVGGALLGATVSYTITNGLSFDPLRVRTTPGPQGHMIVVIRSGSTVLGRDSVNGATTPLPPSNSMSRAIALAPDSIGAPISMDITVNSPVGDSPVFINANANFQASASIINLRAANVRVNVSNTVITNSADTLDLADIDESITGIVQSATLEMTITNPWPVTGNLAMNFTAPASQVSKTMLLPGATNPPSAQVRTVGLTAQDVKQLLGQQVAMGMSGGVSSVAPILVTPKQKVSISNRLILTIRTRG